LENLKNFPEPAQIKDLLGFEFFKEKFKTFIYKLVKTNFLWN